MAFNIETAYNELYPHFRERIQRNEALSHHSCFGAGGSADLWISLKSLREMMGLVNVCAEEHWPLLLVGNGTNILYADAGVRGIVAQISLDRFTVEDNGDGTALLVAEAGVTWPHLLRELAPMGWGGLEFGVVIPGTLGGGVITNAGTHNRDLGQVLEWIEVLDTRRSGQSEENEINLPLIRRYMHEELDLSYRRSRFRDRHRVRFDTAGHLIPGSREMIEPAEIIMRLGIKLHKEDPQNLHKLINENALLRKEKQPLYKYTGIIFKDPPGETAGHLIEQTGMKDRTLGQAQVSTVDPNYIVNLGTASATDIATLITVMHQRVLEQFAIDLEVEVELRGEWMQPAEKTPDPLRAH